MYCERRWCEQSFNSIIIYTESQKKVSQNVLYSIFYKTQQILIKFGGWYPE